MILLRRLLLKLRELDAKPKLKGLSLKLWLVVIIILTTAIGLIFDTFLPFNLLTNCLRMLVACILGLSVFSIVYLLSIIQGATLSKQIGYTPLRKRFSYKQRTHLSVFGGFCLLALLMFVSHEGLQYTFLSGLVVSGYLGLLTFARTYRSEYIKSVHGIPDVRDIKFEKKEKLRKQLEEERG